MSTTWRAVIVVGLVVAVGVVLAAKYAGGPESNSNDPADTGCPAGPATRTDQVGDGSDTAWQESTTAKALPVLMEFGAGRCMACRQMKPIIRQIESDYAGRLKVKTVDVFADRALAGRYDIRVIPTQVFLGPTGEELWRHQGVISAPKIVAKWKELGYDLDAEQ